MLAAANDFNRGSDAAGDESLDDARRAVVVREAGSDAYAGFTDFATAVRTEFAD
ncbi:MAG TPA: hypothetical protein VN213_07600 [Solirubrobacteraceae bacterium]|nr:hypothetical protein [Solirubrobacteraceae bacterium]